MLYVSDVPACGGVTLPTISPAIGTFPTSLVLRVVLVELLGMGSLLLLPCLAFHTNALKVGAHSLMASLLRHDSRVVATGLQPCPHSAVIVHVNGHRATLNGVVCLGVNLPFVKQLVRLNLGG